MLRLDFNLVFTILNIVIWYVLIRKFLFKPINNIITKREEALNARYVSGREGMHMPCGWNVRHVRAAGKAVKVQAGLHHE